MNIHFYDVETLHTLRKSTLEKFSFGSVTYGMNNENSDEDYICVVTTPYSLKNSFLWEHHNLQYKTKNEDYVFTTLHNFIRNLITGDMPGNFEVIHSEQCKTSSLKFLYENKHMFYTYSNLKSYLGYVKRDLKYANTDANRLFHAYRGILFYEMILNDTFELDLRKSHHSSLLWDIKNDNITKNNKYTIIDQLKEKSQYYREELNKNLDNGDIHKFMSIANMKLLDEWIYDITNSDTYKNKEHDFDITPFYDALENGVRY